MKKIILIQMICFVISGTLLSQATKSDTTYSKFKYSIGGGIGKLQLVSSIKENTQFTENPERILLSSKGNYNSFIYLSVETKSPRWKNLYRQIELGFSRINGQLEYKELGGSSILIDNVSYEFQRYKNIEFREFQFYSSYQVKKIILNSFSFAIGPQLSARIKKTNNGIIERSIYEGNLPPNQSDQYSTSNKISSDDNFISAQLSITAEIGKTFRIKNSTFNTGIKYSRGITNFHNAGDTKISNISYYLKYYL